MKQFTKLVAKQPFNFRNPGSRGREVKVKVGDSFLITSPTYLNKDTAMIDRAKKAHIGQGYLFSISTILDLFEVN